MENIALFLSLGLMIFLILMIIPTFVTIIIIEWVKLLKIINEILKGGE